MAETHLVHLGQSSSTFYWRHGLAQGAVRSCLQNKDDRDVASTPDRPCKAPNKPVVASIFSNKEGMHCDRHDAWKSQMARGRQFSIHNMGCKGSVFGVFGPKEAAVMFVGLAELLSRAVLEFNKGGSGLRENSGPGGFGGGRGGDNASYHFGSGDVFGYGVFWTLTNTMQFEEEAKEPNVHEEPKTKGLAVLTMLKCIVQNFINILRKGLSTSKEVIDYMAMEAVQAGEFNWEKEYVSAYQGDALLHEELFLEDFEEVSMSGNTIPCSSSSETVVDNSHSPLFLGTEQDEGRIRWPIGLLWRRRGNESKEELKTLTIEAVADALKQLMDAGATLPIANRSDVDALKRLQREVFLDLMKLRDRLEKIEQMNQVRKAEGGVARTRMKGEVKAGAAFVLTEDTCSRHSRDSLENVGMLSGLDVRFSFETSFREKDLLFTQFVAGQGSSVGDRRAFAGPLTLGKLHYMVQLNDEVTLSFIPFGAKGKDVTEIINPLQDQGLTQFSSNGPALFSYCKGSAFGANVSGSRFAFSFVQYLSGWSNQFSSGEAPYEAEKDPLCLTSLAQLLLQPYEGLILAFAGLNRYWPSPRLPSSAGLHWSEMGPLVIPKIWSSSRSSTPHGAAFMEGSLESKGTSLMSLAVSTELDVSEDISVGAWVQIERGDLHDPEKGSFQWCLNMCKVMPSRGIGWGASIGSSCPDMWSIATSEEVYPGNGGYSYCPQMQIEAFIKMSWWNGLTLQPGVMCVINSHCCTPALILGLSWSL